jgi:hypothetical protein
MVIPPLSVAIHQLNEGTDVAFLTAIIHFLPLFCIPA